MSEAMVLATKSGVDPEQVYQAIRGGLAGSTVLDAKVPLVLDRNFKPGFMVTLLHKDLKNVLKTGELAGVPTPFTNMASDMLEQLIAQGKGGLDYSSIIQIFEAMAQVEVKKS